MRRIEKWIVLSLVGTLLGACQSCDQDKQRQREIARQLEPKQLIERNKEKVQKENAQIDGYIKRRKWDMVETGTGLRYEVYKAGDGTQGAMGREATINYSVFLINGDKIYSSDQYGPQTFEIGKADVESGLHEAMTYLKGGDHARLIIPSYLAHGIAGDRNKIPGDATVIYDLEVVSIK